MKSCWVLPTLCAFNAAFFGYRMAHECDGVAVFMVGISLVNLAMTWPTARQRAEA